MKNITISIQKSKREKRNLGSPRNFWEIFPKGTTTLNKNSIIEKLFILDKISLHFHNNIK